MKIIFTLWIIAYNALAIESFATVFHPDDEAMDTPIDLDLNGKGWILFVAVVVSVWKRFREDAAIPDEFMAKFVQPWFQKAEQFPFISKEPVNPGDRVSGKPKKMFAERRGPYESGAADR